MVAPGDESTVRAEQGQLRSRRAWYDGAVVEALRPAVVGGRARGGDGRSDAGRPTGGLYSRSGSSLDKDGDSGTEGTLTQEAEEQSVGPDSRREMQLEWGGWGWYSPSLRLEEASQQRHQADNCRLELRVCTRDGSPGSHRGQEREAGGEMALSREGV